MGSIIDTLGLGGLLESLPGSPDGSGLDPTLAGALSPGSLLAFGAAAACGYVFWEQVRFFWYRQTKKGAIPGPSLATPLVGGILEMIKEPHAFWEKQKNYAFPGFSWNSIVGFFVVYITDPTLAKQAFNSNSADTLLLECHPNGRFILGSKNIAFMHGPNHKALRRSFLPLFTRRALSSYIGKQDKIIRAFFQKLLEVREAQEVRKAIRDLNALTSQEVFVGPYLDDAAEREEFSKAYIAMTEGFLVAPLPFPGTALWRARQGRFVVLHVLEKVAIRAKQRMAAGGDPDCLLDYWAQQILRDEEEAKARGVAPPHYAAIDEMAYVVMDFLFASQDASTASLCWTITQLAEHPDVLEKVREEQLRTRAEQSAVLSGDVLSSQPYTRQVVKEVLRFRPPAQMMPMRVQKRWKLTDSWSAPRGSLVVPSIIAVCQQGYANADKFDPDRFGPQRQEDKVPNYLVFGHGPHYCVGKEYAMNHVHVFAALLATELDFTRVRSASSDKILYLPTQYPADTVFKFTPKA